MEKKQQENELSWKMVDLLVLTKHRLIKLADAHGLTFPLVYLLCKMRPGVALQMNHVSSLLSCDASNATGLVDRLLKLEMLSREESPSDRRVKMITLTEKGEQLRRDLLAETPGSMTGYFGDLSAEELARLEELVDRLRPAPPMS